MPIVADLITENAALKKKSRTLHSAMPHIFVCVRSHATLYDGESDFSSEHTQKETAQQPFI